MIDVEYRDGRIYSVKTFAEMTPEERAKIDAKIAFIKQRDPELDDESAAFQVQIEAIRAGRDHLVIPRATLCALVAAIEEMASAISDEYPGNPVVRGEAAVERMFSWDHPDWLDAYREAVRRCAGSQD